MSQVEPKVKRLTRPQAALLLRCYDETVNAKEMDGNTSKAVKALMDAGLVRRLHSGVLVVTQLGEARIAQMVTRNKREAQDGTRLFTLRGPLGL